MRPERGVSAAEILVRLQERVPPVPGGVDRVVLGQAKRLHRTAAVTWMAGLTEARAAADVGATLLICHEPVFWDHLDSEVRRAEDAAARAKERALSDLDLTVLRVHDAWDAMPAIGIPWAWARFLFPKAPLTPSNDGLHLGIEIETAPVEDLARKIVRRISDLGQTSLQLVAPEGLPVSRVGVGTGCIGDIDSFRDLGCEAAILADDGALYWKELQKAADTGFGILRVNHAVAEEPGMSTLTEWIATGFPALEVRYLGIGCRYRNIEIP